MRLSRAQYEMLAASFRAVPGGISAAARAASVTRATARRAWEIGWEEAHDWAVPIKVLIHREAIEARAARETAAQKAKHRDEDTLRAAADDARETQARELQLVRAVQGVAGAALNQGIAVHRAAGPLAKAMAEELERLATSGAPSADPKATLALLRDVTRYANQAAELARLAMKLERLWGDRPTEVGGYGYESTDEALAELGRLREAQELWERGGGALRLVQGGGAE